MRSSLVINTKYLQEIEFESKYDFIEWQRNLITDIIENTAKNQKRACEVPYHPLLDSFFEELIQSGLKIQSRTLDKITLSWST